MSRLLQRARPCVRNRLQPRRLAGVVSASFPLPATRRYSCGPIGMQRGQSSLQLVWISDAIHLSPRAVGQGNAWLSCSARGHVEGRKGERSRMPTDA